MMEDFVMYILSFIIIVVWYIASKLMNKQTESKQEKVEVKFLEEPTVEAVIVQQVEKEDLAFLFD